MAQITATRTLFGVQCKLASNNMQCVASWFTEQSEAFEYFKQVEMLCNIENPVYCTARLVTLRLPDAFENCDIKVILES